MFTQNLSLRRLFIVLLAICAALLIGAYGLEYLYDILPCFLCMLQRYVFFGTIGIIILGLIFNHRFFMLLVALGFFINTGLAFYQVGIEHHIFQLPSVCKAELASGTLEELKTQLLQKPVIPCDQVQWELFGISLAGYNGIVSFLLFLFSYLQFLRFHKND